MGSLFDGLEELGFNDMKGIELFIDKKALQEKNKSEEKKEPKSENYIFLRPHSCPICKNKFEDRSVRTSKMRLVSNDIDLKPNYEPLNPSYYDVVICQKCGYAALTNFFPKISKYGAKAIKEQITPKYKPKDYPMILTLDHAIERYKLALLNTVIKNGKASEKGFICMKLAWLYRDKKDEHAEKMYLKNALKGYEEAFESEYMPIVGMEENTVMYLISCFHFLLEQYAQANLWLSRIIVSKTANSRVKDKAKFLRDEIREKEAKQ